MTFRIAHISDLHVLALQGNSPWRFLNKRLTGYANLRYRRRHVHLPEVLARILQGVHDGDFDHVVVTGDLTNLALPSEYQAVQKLLTEILRASPERVSVVPGNHDVYTGGAARSHRFTHFFADYLRSDLPAAEPNGSAFPFVKLRGPVALIGLTTAVPRPPMIASGKLGVRQLHALSRILRDPQVRERLPVLLLHHPPIDPPSLWKKVSNGLDDAGSLVERLALLPRGLVLHGHLHRRIHRVLVTPHGQLDVVGATSASLLHEDPERMAGINVYEISEDHSVAVTARVLDQKRSALVPQAVRGDDTPIKP